MCVGRGRGGRGEGGVCVHVDVIAQVSKGVCGWDSLDYCRNVCVCVHV